VPAAGTLPASVAVAAQTFWFPPAAETVGIGLTVIVLLEEGPIVQKKPPVKLHL